MAKKRLHFHALVKLLFDYQRVTNLPVAASRRVLVLTAPDFFIETNISCESPLSGRIKERYKKTLQ